MDEQPIKPKEKLDAKFWIETARKSIIVVIIIIGLMITFSTLMTQNTYCKITPKYEMNNTIGGGIRYETKEMIREQEPGFYRTHYGLGTLIIPNETIAKEIECKTKFLKIPISNTHDIKKYIFNESD